MTFYAEIIKQLLNETKQISEQNIASGLASYESPAKNVAIRTYSSQDWTVKEITSDGNKTKEQIRTGFIISGNDEEEILVKSKSKYKTLIITGSKKLVWFRPSKVIRVNYPDQTNYSYKLRRPMGQWPEYPEFQPDLTPEQIMCAGIDEGFWKFKDCFVEFPREWYLKALDLNKIAVLRPLKTYNKYKVYPLEYVLNWREEEKPEEPEDETLLYHHDPRGWLQWYFRFYLGRRIPRVDKVRIRRWIFFKKKFLPLIQNCRKGDLNCKPRLKQAMLHWAIDPEKYGK